ncbi:hypothetical protein V5O48_000371 [Marasmius crinis-equi]|uniref:Major facilitator superfamily (MFS) profile domain-containing protein n=1 Tax=Marasmius crinis-equi TaxID=585013 RepID=A0ABR3G1Y2_9AGAR
MASSFAESNCSNSTAFPSPQPEKSLTLDEKEPPLSSRDVQGGEGSGQREVDVEASTRSVPSVSSGSDDLDGGRIAWMTIAGCWLVQFCTIGYSNAFGVYQDFYTREFLSNTSPSDISWIGSFQLFMQYAPGILVGHAFDAGYFRFMLVFGSFLEVFSLLMLSLAHREQYYQVFLAQAVGLGLGQGLLFIPSLAIIPRYFKKRRAFATGVAVTGASLGGIIWPIVLNQISQRTSFANAVRATGGLAGVMLCCANILIRAGPPQRPRMEVAEASRKGGMGNILRDGAFMVSIAAACLVAFGLFFPYFYLQLYALDKALSPDLAFYAIAILNAGSIVGRLLPNFFADRIGGYNLIVPCLLATSILLFAMLGVNTSAGVVVFGLLYGCMSGSCTSIARAHYHLTIEQGLESTWVGLFGSFNYFELGAYAYESPSDFGWGLHSPW